MDSSAPPLSGIRVLDMATNFAATGAAMFLADYGADVIKIELPAGDPARTSPPVVQGTNIGKSFLIYNRGKRSAVIDWRSDTGQQTVDRMLGQVDVVVVDAPVGARSASWRFHYHRRLKALFPRLIYAGVSAFGRRGPYVDFPPYDPLVQAASGIMGTSRNREGNPVHAGSRLADSSTSMLLAYGVMMALLAREKTGTGQRVETSMLEASVAMQSVQLVWADSDPTPPADPAQATVASYQCEDGRYINIITMQERQFEGMCRVLGLEHLLEDKSFSTGEGRTRRRTELFPLFEGIFGTRPSAEWLPLLQAAGVPCSPTLSRVELFDDPQIVLNHVSAELTHPTLGRMKMLGSPIRFSETPLQIAKSAPELGEHTNEVLNQFGFSAQEIAELARAGVIQHNKEGR